MAKTQRKQPVKKEDLVKAGKATKAAVKYAVNSPVVNPVGAFAKRFAERSEGKIKKEPKKKEKELSLKDSALGKYITKSAGMMKGKYK